MSVYLIGFNAVSAIGWAVVLWLTLSVLASQSGTPIWDSATNDLSRTLLSLVAPWIPPSYSASWWVVAPVQSLAALEVFHVLFGLVRSPLLTTLLQVTSRLILVWLIVARFPSTHLNPFYTTMVLAWSLTEVLRYTYYTLSLMSARVPHALTWLRYTTFYVLYPLGAGSEALVVLSTIPEWKHGQYVKWGLEDWLKAGQVLLWIPGNYCNSPCPHPLLTTSTRLVGHVYAHDADAAKGPRQRK
ncbi:tyrosine phosphatase-like protein [Scleroderma yunnanense]